MEDEGCRVVKVITLLDRQQGGSDGLRKRGYDFVALLKADASFSFEPLILLPIPLVIIHYENISTLCAVCQYFLGAERPE